MTWPDTGIPAELVEHGVRWGVYFLRHFEGPLIAFLIVALVAIVFRLWHTFSG